MLGAGVLAVVLLQQVVRWSVEGQALVLFLEAIPGAGEGQAVSGGWLYLKPLPLAHSPRLPSKLLTSRPGCCRSRE